MLESRSLPPLYPYLFPVKIIGRTSPEFEADVLSVMRNYLGEIREEEIGRRESRAGRYLSLTFHIIAQSREHLEQLYAELNARSSVIMVI
jgi:putative lipoic acid-binding regulatory protein